MPADDPQEVHGRNVVRRERRRHAVWGNTSAALHLLLLAVRSVAVWFRAGSCPRGRGGWDAIGSASYTRAVCASWRRLQPVCSPGHARCGQDRTGLRMLCNGRMCRLRRDPLGQSVLFSICRARTPTTPRPQVKPMVRHRETSESVRMPDSRPSRRAPGQPPLSHLPTQASRHPSPPARVQFQPHATPIGNVPKQDTARDFTPPRRPDGCLASRAASDKTNTVCRAVQRADCLRPGWPTGNEHECAVHDVVPLCTSR